MARVGDEQITRSIKPIVRSCGERTTRLAVGLLTQVFPEVDIEVVREVPFEKALRATYETAIASGREWAFVMDADVLPSPRRLREALALCSDRADDIFVYRGLVLDKFFGWPREVGNYFYRTRLLSTALDLIPEAGSEVRPESSTIMAMHDRGHRMETVEGMIYAVHDFEQFFRDLFRKGFVYASKHPAMQILMADWERKGRDDADHRIMLAGAIAHGVHGGEVKIDVRRFPHDLNELLSTYGLTEKDPLSEREVAPDRVDDLISAWEPSPVFHAYHAFCGVWPQHLFDLSPSRLRALVGWMRQSWIRGSLGAELRHLMQASFGRGRRTPNQKVDFRALFADDSDRTIGPKQ